MKKFFILYFLTIVHWHISHAQFIDDFSDNDFSGNPSWTGNENKFTAGNGELRLQADALVSSAYLSTSSRAVNNATWEFSIQMDFNPSSSNLAKVFLVSDQPDLSATVNGYFIKIGDTADEISLYRRDGLKEVEIIDGLDGRLNTSMVKVGVKATRDDQGNWQLFSDAGFSGNYTMEGNAVDLTYFSSSYFGVYCKYSATRSDKFHFDNFIVSGDPQPDVTPPVLTGVQVTAGNQIEISFSEQVDPVTAEAVMNYDVNNIGNPVSVELQADGNTLLLDFNNNFPNGVSCVVTISNVKDQAGNVMATTEKTFLFFQPHPVGNKDIIITEIFADPDPAIGLPQAEYIELFNRSSNPINIQDWHITDGTSKGTFPFLIILPDEYLIVSASSNADWFIPYGKNIGIVDFPTLNNDGDVLVLKDVDDATIDSVQYNLTWYQDDDKKNGGWSLELIDPENVCSEAANWLASENEDGGSPGKQNSVYANKPDLTGPKLLAAIAQSTNTLTLFFNEKLNKAIPLKTDFTINPSIAIADLSFSDPSLTAIDLSFSGNIQSKTLYTVSLQNIYDCAGNIIQQDHSSAIFAQPEEADSLDIIVNEILFNPRSTGVDFLEVYNHSSKYINLKNFSIANVVDEKPVNANTITDVDLLLPPSAYLVFTEDNNVLKGEYLNAHEENLIRVKSLPPFNDDEGTAAIVNQSGKIIDHLAYSKTMHDVFIKDEEGVSLERIDFSAPTNGAQNWKSAGTDAGNATPGYLNSNARNETVPSESIKIEPEIFIPVYGHPDYTIINYNFQKGGYVANVRIYDTEGREIKRVANNEVLGTSGFFRWDGDQNNGNKTRVGYYVLSFEIFNDEGEVKTFKKRIVVAARF